MATLTKAGESIRRKPSIIDKKNYSYDVGNGGTNTTIYWRYALEDLSQAVEPITFFVDGFETTPRQEYIQQIENN